ncbi:hypothetical protein GF318_04690 [Candidatus Micrarchaeota archaeon]|nr:hypothetical protein [Candidatus Micrarchaeota archaeon]
MVASLDILDDEKKKRIIKIWKDMNEADKAHFINQVALALSVWGSDKKAKKMVVKILGIMTDNGTGTLADFGLYVEKALKLEESDEMKNDIKRAVLIIEGYRVKNALSSEPHLELV